MRNQVVELIGEALVKFRRFYDKNRTYFPEEANVYPVPFFGDIRNATVLTLALNPAWTEFRPSRHWILGLDACALTTRLLHYFDLPAPIPHRWFQDRREGLASLGSSYETDAAHIDLHPLPTKFREDLTEPQRKDIGRLIENHSALHLARLLKVAKRARLVLAVDYTFSKSDGTSAKTSDFINTHEPIIELLRSKESALRIFSAGGPKDFNQKLAEHQETLRKHLRGSS